MNPRVLLSTLTMVVLSLWLTEAEPQIAFTSSRQGNSDIFVVAPEGGSARQVTTNPKADHSPVWSPSGAEIAFISLGPTPPPAFEGDIPFAQFNIWVVGADGTGLRQITGYDFIQTFPVEAMWTPAGEPGGVLRADISFFFIGVDIRVAPPWPGYWGHPRWSPDHRHIAFLGADFNGGPADIFVFDTETEGLTNLTRSPEDDANPSWSPDGRRVAFDSDREGNHEIFVMNADGSEPRPLADLVARRSTHRLRQRARRQLRDLRDERRRHGRDEPDRPPGSGHAARLVPAAEVRRPAQRMGSDQEAVLPVAEGWRRQRTPSPAAGVARSRARRCQPYLLSPVNSVRCSSSRLATKSGSGS